MLCECEVERKGGRGDGAVGSWRCLLELGCGAWCRLLDDDVKEELGGEME